MPVWPRLFAIIIPATAYMQRANLTVDHNDDQLHSFIYQIDGYYE